MNLTTIARACLLGTFVMACQGGSDDASSSATECIGVGDAVVRDLDWSPVLDEVAALLSWPDGSMSIARIQPGDPAATELVRSVDIIPADITIDADGVVYWQRTEAGRSVLERSRSGDTVDTWPAPGLGYGALEATLTELFATELVAIGAEADIVNLVEIEPQADGEISSRIDVVVPGLQSMSMAPDRSIVALGSQAMVGGNVSISVSGQVSWVASLDDASGSPISVAPTGSSVMYRQTSTSMAMLVDSHGLITPSALGEMEVLAFDVSPTGTVAASSANFTGGPGSVCFVAG